MLDIGSYSMQSVVMEPSRKPATHDKGKIIFNDLLINMYLYCLYGHCEKVQSQFIFKEDPSSDKQVYSILFNKVSYTWKWIIVEVNTHLHCVISLD